jgi:enoyl reductase-like protein
VGKSGNHLGLSDDFEPWFPAKKDGRLVEDLGDMTYEETVLRLVRSMYVTHEDRWLDLSLCSLTARCGRLRRVDMNGAGPKASEFQSYSSLDKPSISSNAASTPRRTRGTDRPQCLDRSCRRTSCGVCMRRTILR